MTDAEETLEQFNGSTETLRRLYCSHGGTIREFDAWLAQVPSRYGSGWRGGSDGASEVGFRAAWEAALLSVQRTSNLTEWVNAYIATAEPDSDTNLTLIREARAEATELRRHDDEMSERVSDLLVMLASALAAKVSDSDRKTVKTDTGNGLNAWVPDFISQPPHSKGLSLDPEDGA